MQQQNGFAKILFHNHGLLICNYPTRSTAQVDRTNTMAGLPCGPNCKESYLPVMCGSQHRLGRMAGMSVTDSATQLLTAKSHHC